MKPNATLPPLLPVRRQRLVPWLLPVVEDLVYDLGHDLLPHIVTAAVVRQLHLLLRDGDARMRAEYMYEAAYPACY
jgi:hypothetical protein